LLWDGDADGGHGGGGAGVFVWAHKGSAKAVRSARAWVEVRLILCVKDYSFCGFDAQVRDFVIVSLPDTLEMQTEKSPMY
jgi:hypothetical protein